METVDRIEKADWPGIEQSLNQFGNAVLPCLFTPAHCRAISELYDQGEGFRSHVIMARHGFGRGEYKYFSYPLPDPIQEVRQALYPKLAPVANRWNAAMKSATHFPATLDAFLETCHAAHQVRPTPLLLKYGQGDYNCLHQDLYGDHVFPLQLTVLLSQPGDEFSGGEFVMTELSTDGQRAQVVPLQQGDAVIFAVNQRVTAGKRGSRKVRMRHGVSEVRRGHRFTVGIIFHDAK